MGQWQEDMVVRRDNPGIDAFGHLRVSNSEALVSVLGQYDAEPLEMEAGATGTGVAPAHNTTTRMTRLVVNPGSGTSFLQSYVYWTYQPGRSQRVELTGRLNTPVAGAVTDFGYFDADNGIFYRQNDGLGVQFVIRSKTSGVVVNRVVDQANWNLDKMDGTGPSGLTLDTTKVFILTMDFEFLGMGRVRMGFNINGVIVYAHQFLHSNLDEVPYMQTATLPIQMLLTGVSTPTLCDAFFKGALVISEGGLLKERGFTFASPERAVVAASGARTHLFSVRPKLLFNGIVNRESYVTRTLELVHTQANGNPVQWELVAGVNFSPNPTWTDVNTQFSGTEVSTAGTFLNLIGGVVLKSGYVSAGNQGQNIVSIPLDLHHPITLNRAGQNTPVGTLSVLVSGIGGTAAIRGCLNFTELR